LTLIQRAAACSLDVYPIRSNISDTFPIVKFSLGAPLGAHEPSAYCAVRIGARMRSPKENGELDAAKVENYSLRTCLTRPGSDPLGGAAMLCPRCRYENPTDVKCRGQGDVSLVAICPACGATPLRRVGCVGNASHRSPNPFRRLSSRWPRMRLGISPNKSSRHARPRGGAQSSDHLVP
jgi:hypothetical protein